MKHFPFLKCLTLLKCFVLALFFSLVIASPVSADDGIYDPFEDFNRNLFKLNDRVDVYVAEPVAKRYGKITTPGMRRSVGNFFDNLRYPQYLVSDLLQFKVGQAFEHTGRFLINSTLGVAGLFDVANEFGIEPHREDFALAMAYHGVGSGPYLVLPFLGPSNLRDAVGDVVDRFLNPIYWLSSLDEVDDETAFGVSLGLTILELVHTRHGLLDAVSSAKESSLDYYLFVQSSYYQFRRGLLYDGEVPDDDDWDDDDWDDDWDADDFDDDLGSEEDADALEDEDESN